MKKELFERLKTITNEEIEKFVEDELKFGVFYEAVKSGISGWHYDVIAYADGTIDFAGPFSTGSMLMDTYEGNNVCLCSLNADIEINDSYFNVDDIEQCFSEKEQKILCEAAEAIEYDCDAYNAIECINEAYDVLVEAGELWNVVVDKCSQGYRKYQDQLIEAEWDNYYKDAFIEKIENGIEREIDYHNSELEM